MITKTKIQLFKKYNGEVDDWVKIASKKGKLLMVNSDWYIINDLIQDLQLIKRGLTSLEFDKLVATKLIENCDNEETIDLLKTSID